MFFDHEQIGVCLNLFSRSVKWIHADFRQYGTIPNVGESVVWKERVSWRCFRDVDVEVKHHMIHTIYVFGITAEAVQALFESIKSVVPLLDCALKLVQQFEAETICVYHCESLDLMHSANI
jgi:hypothetical protein